MLICKKTMQPCVTKSMCAPFQGCSTPRKKQTVTDRELMQMALDALIEADERDGCRTYKEEIEAIRVALAKGEQEPKPQAWMLITESGACGGIFRFRYDAEVQARELGSRFSIVPLYGAPIAASDISAEPVAKSEESRQVPVAWGIANTRPTEKNPLMMVMLDKPEVSNLVVPLYTAPPQREWQGLTDADIKEFLPSAYRKPPVKIPPGWEQMIHGLEARLKEKNK